MPADLVRTRDRGFTLLETIVVVLLVSVLASVMVAVVAVIVRNAPTTETRIDNSNSYRGLISWMPQDVASTPPTGFVFGSASTICNGATAGSSLLQLTWTLDAGTPTTYAADYRLVGTTTKEIERHGCSGSGSAPYGNSRVLDATEALFDASAAPRYDGPVVVGATMTLITCNPDDDCASAGPTITFAAGSRNPADTLPP